MTQSPKPPQKGFTPAGKFTLFAIFIAVVAFCVWKFDLLPKAKVAPTAVPEKSDYSSGATPAPTAASGDVPTQMPSGTPLADTTACAKMDLIAWNAEAALALANGGITTTKGSLMAANGVSNLWLNRQDDYGVQQGDLIKFAKALSEGDPNPKVGAALAGYMGDGGPAYLEALNNQLLKLDDGAGQYIAEVFYSTGISRGEDKFMGQPEWAKDPQTAKGAVVACVPKDGDFNIAVYWASSNNIPINTNEKTWDPNAINFAFTSTFIEADNLYITGAMMPFRDVSTGKHVKKQVNGVCTWTPGDVAVVKNKGGLVTIASTADYIWQMPQATIGIKKWLDTHQQWVEGFIAACDAAAKQMQTNVPGARLKAGEVCANVFKEETGQYWMKYFVGATEMDAQGNAVQCGGSKVNTLADNLHLFGLLPGSSNLFQATYNTFGKYTVQYFPNDLQKFPPYSQVFTTKFIENVASRSTAPAKPELPSLAGKQPTEVIGTENVTVNFSSGSHKLPPAEEKKVLDLAARVSLAGGFLELEGHTDGDGSPEANLILSRDRVLEVKGIFQRYSSTNFPDTKVRTSYYGEDQKLVDPERTSADKAKNRRVVIKIMRAGQR